MDTKEKILLVQLLLEDIGYDCEHNADGRALKAKSLCEELAIESRNDDFTLLADFCDTYVRSSKRWTVDFLDSLSQWDIIIWINCTD